MTELVVQRRTWKLSEDQVIEIFMSDEPPKILTARYGIKHTTVSKIKNRHQHQRVTKWLPGPHLEPVK